MTSAPPAIRCKRPEKTLGERRFIAISTANPIRNVPNATTSMPESTSTIEVLMTLSLCSSVLTSQHHARRSSLRSKSEVARKSASPETTVPITRYAPLDSPAAADQRARIGQYVGNAPATS